jgi:hypothetical protein
VALDVLHATEFLLPATGGAERTILERLGALAERGHRVRAVWLERPVTGTDAPTTLPEGVEGSSIPAPPPAPYWRNKRERREAMGAAVSAALQERPADIVVTALHAAPAVIDAARAAGGDRARPLQL